MSAAPEVEARYRATQALDPARAASMSEEEFRLLRELVREHCGILFRDDGRPLLERRLAPRLAALGRSSFSDYHRHLRGPAGDAELDEAIDLLTTNETYFWREPLQLEAFASEILPALEGEHARERRLRILSAGCSTGEEAYTLAALVKGAGLFDGWDVEIVGVDISRRCLAQARAGAYGEHAFRSPEAASMRRFCHPSGGRWVVDDALKRMVRFSRENLLDPRALSGLPRVDVVVCRNVMIYLDLAARKTVLRRLHAKLREGGWLLLGHAESLLDASADFELVHLRKDLVHRRPGGVLRVAS